MITDNNDGARDLSYWHITIPGIDTILKRNKKVIFSPVYHQILTRTVKISRVWT